MNLIDCGYVCGKWIRGSEEVIVGLSRYWSDGVGWVFERGMELGLEGVCEGCSRGVATAKKYRGFDRRFPSAACRSNAV